MRVIHQKRIPRVKSIQLEKCLPYNILRTCSVCERTKSARGVNLSHAFSFYKWMCLYLNRYFAPPPLPILFCSSLCCVWMCASFTLSFNVCIFIFHVSHSPSPPAVCSLKSLVCEKGPPTPRVMVCLKFVPSVSSGNIFSFLFRCHLFSLTHAWGHKLIGCVNISSSE